MEKIVFLHHSTGGVIWDGKVNRYLRKLLNISDVKTHFKNYNKKYRTEYEISELYFPKSEPYGWNNYPYDYYNIWVKNAGEGHYMEEPTLEILTQKYDAIVFKHCYPVSKILEDTGMPDINSKEKRLENYKLQYEALKEKMHQFPRNKFVVWTPAVMGEASLSIEEAKRTYDFYQWIINEWDEKGDNIYVWDFYQYETEGSYFLKEKYAVSSEDPHPNKEFAGRIAPLFAQFLIDVLENKIK